MSDFYEDPVMYIDEFGVAWRIFYSYDIDGNIVEDKCVLA